MYWEREQCDKIPLARKLFRIHGESPDIIRNKKKHPNAYLHVVSMAVKKGWPFLSMFMASIFFRVLASIKCALELN